MAHNIEIKTINGVEVASFAENTNGGKQQRAWHGLGDDQQIFDRPMFVEEALKACHADFTVKTQPVVALNDKIVHAMENEEMISADELLSLIIPNTRATMRTDTDKALGIVSDSYQVVDNKSAFQFVDTFCSGKFGDRDNTPVIETCGVLGQGERIFVTAKFPKQIVLDAKRDDLADAYAIFTTSHDGTGAVKVVTSFVRAVCNNTLQLALNESIGRMQFRHTANVGKKMDLLNEENTEIACKSLGMVDMYTKVLKEAYDNLRNIKVKEEDVNKIVADIALSEQAKKVYFETKNINHEDIATRGRNIFLKMKECIESGVGQDILESGNGQWLLNGITSYYQNVQKYHDNQTKFDSIMNGSVSKKVQRAYDMLVA